MDGQENDKVPIQRTETGEGEVEVERARERKVFKIVLNVYGLEGLSTELFGYASGVYLT